MSAITILCGRHVPSCPQPCLSDDNRCALQLVYQATVFLSRSSISLGLPPLPARLLPLPAVLQFVILATLAYESAVGFFSVEAESANVLFVFLLVCVEGVCGGLA